jgi:hypothetical protein
MHGIRWAAAIVCLLVVGVGSVRIMRAWSGFSGRGNAASVTAAGPGSPGAVGEEDRPVVATFPDPIAPGTGQKVFSARYDFDNGIFATAASAQGPVANALSLAELTEAIQTRGPRARAYWSEREKRLKLSSPPTTEEAVRAIRTWRSLAYVELYEGQFADAERWLRRGLELSRIPGVPSQDRAYSLALLGISALRRGELDNCVACVGPSSCIFPLEPAAIHQNPAGSRDAIKHFTAYLQEWPGDLQIRWLLNIAHMTVGEYPDRVPAAYLIPLDRFHSKGTAGRFTNVAVEAGVTARGPTMAGGSIFDDFTGDHVPDIIATSLDADRGASFFVNRGDGTFEDRSASAGLDRQTYALNLTRADFDNDGKLDVLLLRGGWESPAPLSLLRNRGDGSFEDVTLASGLGEPIACESAAWGDFDNDGMVDVFLCGETKNHTAAGDSPGGGAPADPRNLCRLYRNLGGGKFINVAAEMGVTNGRFAKGAVWGDYDNDGWPDLFVSNMNENGRLYHNERGERFREVTAELGLLKATSGGKPLSSFPCLFWDFDNDGRIDLLINDWQNNQGEIIAGFLGIKANLSSPPRLYRNLGPQGFRDVSAEVGLDSPIATMSINCGDFDNDGYLDLYMGTGWMTFSGLIPNVLLRNVEGRRFEDVTEASGTGHLQKGHGISFADSDADGDLDIFCVQGGGYPGDRGYSALFRNPGGKRHWLKVKLVGTKTNRAALGARLQAEIRGPDGKNRSIHRLIGTNGSFGGNSLVELLGLGESTSVAKLTVSWPTSRTTQVFRDVAADQFLVITEGADRYQAVERTKAVALGQRPGS